MLEITPLILGQVLVGLFVLGVSISFALFGLMIAERWRA